MGIFFFIYKGVFMAGKRSVKTAKSGKASRKGKFPVKRVGFSVLVFVLLWLVEVGVIPPLDLSSRVSVGPTTVITPSAAPSVTPSIAPAPGCAHVDSDNDGICDLCNGDVLAVIDIYAINDLHGKFSDSDAQPGVDEMTTFLKTMRMTSDNFVLISSGDMWQGSSESNLTKGKLITEWMNDLGFDAHVYGNHEFDWGREAILENIEIADFPFLALNIKDRSTKELADYAQSSTIIEREGVKIGIIGAIGDCYSSISNSKVSDVSFSVKDTLTKLVKAEAEKLRSEGCSIIIYSIHDGYNKNAAEGGVITDKNLSGYYDIALSDYVDIVFEGHTHMHYVLKDSKGVWHFQDGGDNKIGLSHAVMEYNKANDTLVVTTAEIVEHEEYKFDFSDDAIVETLLAKYSDEIGDIDSVFATLPVKLTKNELRQLVADLYYDAAIERWGDKYDIACAGGFISARSPGYLSGEVTYADVQMIFPFDNEIVLCTCSGKDLNNNFFESTNDNYFITYGEYGEKVKNRIDPNATYYLVTDTYSSDYKSNHLTVVDRYDPNVYARDLVKDYLIEKYGNLHY